MAFDTLDQDSVATAGLTFSGGGMTVLGRTGSSLSASGNAQSVEGKTSGKWYFEFTCVAVSGNVDGVGLSSSMGVGPNGFLASDAFSVGWGYFTNTHIVNANAAQTAVNNPSWGAGDVIGVAVDLTNKLIWFNKNGGAWAGTSGTPNPATGTGGFSLANMLPHYRAYPCINLSGASAKFTANFGASGFTGSVPSGFTAGWTNTTAGTYFGTMASNGNAPGTISAPTDDKAVSKYTSVVSGTLTSITFPMNTAPTGAKGVIYADSSGSPGALLGVSTNVVTTGGQENVFNFSGVNIVSGTAYWIGTVQTGTVGHIYCPQLANGIDFNSGTYASPSNPFGASPSTANFRYPAIALVSAASRKVPQIMGGG